MLFCRQTGANKRQYLVGEQIELAKGLNEEKMTYGSCRGCPLERMRRIELSSSCSGIISLLISSED